MCKPSQTRELKVCPLRKCLSEPHLRFCSEEGKMHCFMLEKVMLQTHAHPSESLVDAAS